MSEFDNAIFQLKNIASGGSIVNPQQLVERRVLQLMVEFPSMGDADVALLARDEILNLAGDERALLRWATEETVARLRRTLMLNAMRGHHRQMMPPPEPPRRAQQVVAAAASDGALEAVAKAITISAIVAVALGLFYAACAS